jgi:signal peptidase I
VSEHITFRPEGTQTVLRLDEPWTAFVLDMLDQLEAVLNGQRHEPGRPWRRYPSPDVLFPNAYTGRSAAASFRQRYLEGMRRRVLEAVGTVRSTIAHDQPLSPDIVDAWVIALGHARTLAVDSGSPFARSLSFLQDAIVHGGMNAPVCTCRPPTDDALDDQSYNEAFADTVFQPSDRSRGGRLWRPVLVGALTVLIAMLAYGVRVYGDPSDHDRVLVDKLAYWVGDPEPGEIVAFTAPARWDNASTRLFGRVVATSGQVVDCCDPENRLLVNGTPLHEPYRPDAAQALVKQLVVPTGYVWITVDAAHSGLVPVTAILGKARAILYPTDHLAFVDHSNPQE